MTLLRKDGYSAAGHTKHAHRQHTTTNTHPSLPPGFLMTFLRKYGYSAVGLNFFMSALAMIEGEQRRGGCCVC